MKKLFLVLFGLTITTQVLGVAYSPEEEKQLNEKYKENQKTCPADKPLYSVQDKKCYSCDTVERIQFSSYAQDNCSEICPNRKIYSPPRKPYVRGGLTLFCVLSDIDQSVDKKKTELSLFGCMIPEGCGKFNARPITTDCPDDKPLNVNGKCTDCDTDEFLVGHFSGCEKCPNRIKVGDDCPKKCADNNNPILIPFDTISVMDDKPVTNSRCEPCDTELVGIDGCAKCPNRQIIDGKCYKKCPDNKPLLTSNGSCITCDAKETINKGIGIPEMRVTIISGQEKCSPSLNNTSDINKQTDNINKPLRRLLRPTDVQIQTWKQEYKENQEKCPKESPLYVDNRCYSCNDKGHFDINPYIINDFCSYICPNRKVVSDGISIINGGHTYCILNKKATESKQEQKTDCPDDTPLNIGRKCADCNTDKIAYKTNCEKCPNRKLVGSFCLKKHF